MTGEHSPSGSFEYPVTPGIDPGHLEELKALAEDVASHEQDSNTLLLEASRSRLYATWIEAVFFSGQSDQDPALRDEIFIAALVGADVVRNPGKELRGVNDYAIAYANYLHEGADQKEDLAEAHSRMIGT